MEKRFRKRVVNTVNVTERARKVSTECHHWVG